MKLNVSVDNQSFEVEVLNLRTRPVQVIVDGVSYEVWVQDAELQPVVPSTAGHVDSEPVVSVGYEPPASQVGDRLKNVTAPIPGVIISISVKPGDSVAFGQELCVLEAMKMKNLIKSNREGKIGAIHVSTGDQVRHNQVLMEYSD